MPSLPTYVVRSTDPGQERRRRWLLALIWLASLLLMASPGTAVPKSRIISAMSSWESNFSANSVEIYVLKLRRKLAGAGVNIVTLRGVGYALEAE